MRHVVRAACVATWLLPLMVASIHAEASFGAANVLCSQYIKAARTSDILYHQASNWLLGYLSGMNDALKAAKGDAPPINMTNDQALKSAGDYCEANPASTIANAASEWYRALPKSEPESSSIRLNMTAPKLKPLLDRH